MILISALFILLSSRLQASLATNGICRCTDVNGGTVDLSQLDSKNTSSPKFAGVITPDKSLSYSYNPCSSFNCGSFAGSAVCSTNISFSADTNVGTQNSSKCLASQSGRLSIMYSVNSANATQVFLICNSSAQNSVLTALDYDGVTHKLELRSSFCCPTYVPIVTTTASQFVTFSPAQPGSSISAGSVLLIIFFSLTLVYLVVGILYKACIVGARGYEVIPHYEFWSSLPGLIQDGCVFTLQLVLGGSGSSNRAGYSEIDSGVPPRSSQMYQPSQQNPNV